MKALNQKNATPWRGLNLIICLVLMAAAAVGTHQRLLGYDIATGQAGSAFSVAGDWSQLLTPKSLCTLGVVAAGAIVPLLWHNRIYRTVQLVLNVVVTGLWSGVFLSYAFMLGLLANGIYLTMTLVQIVMLVAAFVYPLFGHRSHYCMWLCPLGSAQELMGRVNRRHKLHIPARVYPHLVRFRDLLWGVLMVLLWLGVATAWTDYELFTAFMVEVAPVGVIIAAAIVLVLSAFVPRPYCTFVCPTGTLFKMAQK